jgi:hypothetical protein
MKKENVNEEEYNWEAETNEVKYKLIKNIKIIFKKLNKSTYPKTLTYAKSLSNTQDFKEMFLPSKFIDDIKSVKKLL